MCFFDIVMFCRGIFWPIGERMIYFNCDEKKLMVKANRAVTKKESFSINIFGWKRKIFKITLPLFFKHKKSNSPNWLSKLKFMFLLIFTPFIWVSITYAD